jgi:hypothetical protein
MYRKNKGIMYRSPKISFRLLTGPSELPRRDSLKSERRRVFLLLPFFKKKKKKKTESNKSALAFSVMGSLYHREPGVVDHSTFAAFAVWNKGNRERQLTFEFWYFFCSCLDH